MVPDDNSFGSKPGGLGGARGDRHRLRGPSRIDPKPPVRPLPAQRQAPVQPPPAVQTPKPVPEAPKIPQQPMAKKRVLFVCLGNSCRSQMAETFAKAYGSDILEVHSAGVSPATFIAPLTVKTLAERNLDIGDQFPKGLEITRRLPFDLVINMSGVPLVLAGMRVVEWPVPDPIGQKDTVYRAVADQLETRVMQLILELRNSR